MAVAKVSAHEVARMSILGARVARISSFLLGGEKRKPEILVWNGMEAIGKL